VTPWCGIQPRRWQVEALDALRTALRTTDAALVRACTGAGKSVLIAEIVAGVLARGGRCLISVPSVDLVRQLSRTIAARVGADNVGRYYTHGKQHDRACVVVCLSSLLQLLQKQPTWSVWIVDEAHRLESDTGRAARDAASVAKRVGLTATPFRADARGLLGWDAGAVYEYTVEDAVRDGVLVPWRLDIPEMAAADPLAVDSAPLDTVCAAWIANQTTPGIVNATNIADAEAFAAFLTNAGIPAEAVHSDRSRRANDEALEKLRAGELRAVVHVNLLQEGIDLPWLHWLVMRRVVGRTAENNNRPSVRFVQEVGRVLRSYPGKEYAIFFDPHNQFVKWGLSPSATFADLEEAAAEEEAEPAENSYGSTGERAPASVIVRGPLLAEIQRLYRECIALDLATPTRARAENPVTPEQLSIIAHAFRVRRQHVSQPLRGWLEDEEVWNRLPELNRADASALISVLWAAISHTRDGIKRAALEAK